MDNLPPPDHSQGFRSREEIQAYLSLFKDRADTDVVGFDLFGRATTFGDLRRLAGKRVVQESMSLNFE